MIKSHILSFIKQIHYYKAIVGIIFENLILSNLGGLGDAERKIMVRGIILCFNSCNWSF